MERTVAMPKLGMTMTEGLISHWRVAPGDVVAKDDVLAEVETDKVELEVESPAAGRVLRLLGQEGDTIPVGQPLIVLEVEGDARQTMAPAPVATAVAVSAQVASNVGWSASAQMEEQSSMAATAPAAIEDDIALSSQRIPSTPAARRIARERRVSLASVAEAVQRDVRNEPLRAADVAMYAPAAVAAEQTSVPPLTPLARKMAAAHALSEAEIAVHATAQPGKRVGRAAVAEALAAQTTDQQTPNEHAAGASVVSQTAVVDWSSVATETLGEAEELLPLSGMRRVIAERTTHSFTTTPHIYLDTEVDMAEAELMRASLEKVAAKHGAPVPSVTALLVRIAGVALRQHPQANAGFAPTVNGQKAAIRRWSEVHVGVAVALPAGLVTPVVRHADRKTLAEIHAELAALVQQAREGKLLPDDYQGGTFTISNLGMYGIDTFHAILNEPQAAILAVGKTTRRPSVITDASGHESIAIRPILKLSLSADHRVLDGASGASFLGRIRELLENPYLLV